MNTRLLLMAVGLFLGSVLFSNVALVTGAREVRATDSVQLSPLERMELRLEQLHAEINELRQRLPPVE